jgi:hypothetical protein
MIIPSGSAETSTVVLEGNQSLQWLTKLSHKAYADVDGEITMVWFRDSHFCAGHIQI